MKEKLELTVVALCAMAIFGFLTFGIVSYQTEATIAQGPDTINVPDGKNAIYYLFPDSFNARIHNAVEYWEHDDNLTLGQTAVIFDAKMKGFAWEYVLSAEANLAADAAREAALNQTDPIEG